MSNQIVPMSNQSVPWNAPWGPLGPAPMPNLPGVTGGVSGRVWSIALSPDYNGMGNRALYVGTNGGGIWRSTDFFTARTTWGELTDSLSALPPHLGEKLLNVGALAVDPWHPQTIYAGTGDPPSASGGYARGYMLKSPDGGSNVWELLDFAQHEEPSPGIGQIFVDPTDPTGDTVYANGGFDPATRAAFAIRKSTDGGHSWTVAQNGLPSDIYIAGFDSSIHAGHLVLYAGVKDNSGTNPAATTIWKSEDKGGSWAPMTIAPLIDLQRRRRSQAEIGWISLATNAPQNPVFGGGRPAFAAVGWFDPTHTPPVPGVWEILNIFELDGDTWQPAARGLPDQPNSFIQVTSGFAMAMSPGNDLYMGGVTSHVRGLWQRLFSTGTWVSIDQGVDGSRPHTDHHAWCFVDGDVYNGNDGGISRFKPRVDGTPGPGVWQDLNAPGLQTILVQGIGMHPTRPKVFAEGSQDNGVALRSGPWTHVTVPGESDDRGPVWFDPYDGRYVYATGNSDVIFLGRSDDGGHTWADKSVPDGQNIPDYARLAFHTLQQGRICVGLDRVHETRDRGDHWTAISPALAGPKGQISALAYGMSGPGAPSETILAAYGGGRLFRGGEALGGWGEVFPISGPDWHGTIVSILTDPHRQNRIYAATDQSAIWRSDDDGATWREVDDGVPGGGERLRLYALASRSDSADRDPILFAATSVGVWAAAEQGGPNHWQPMSTNLPETDVTALQFNQTTKNLLAGLYGRGVFGAYLGLTSDFGPGSVAVRDHIFLLAVDLDGRVLVNQAMLNTAYSGWFEVKSDFARQTSLPSQTTNATPGAVAVDDRLFVFAQDASTGRVMGNMATLGGEFLDTWQELQGGGHTDAAPSALAIGNRLFVFIKEAGTGRILLNQATLAGSSWPQWLNQWFLVQGNKQTDAAPGVVAVGNRLFVFIKEAGTGRILYNRAVLDQAFQSAWAEVGDGVPAATASTDAAPSAVAIGNRLFVFIKEAGTGRILLNQATVTGPSTPRWLDHWVEVQGNGRTDAAPAAMTLPGNWLILFVKDADSGRIKSNQALLDQAFFIWQEVGVDGGLD